VTAKHQPSRLVLRTLSEVDRAYLAGIIDGEGSIGRGARRTVWQVHVANTDRALIEWLLLIGGNARVVAPPPPRLGSPLRDPKRPYKTCWTWRIWRGNEVLDLLLAVRPYLRIKAAKADNAIGDLTARIAPERRTA
jgi:hypothetical protein